MAANKKLSAKSELKKDLKIEGLRKPFNQKI
jgi:hypothetical protein